MKSRMWLSSEELKKGVKDRGGGIGSHESSHLKNGVVRHWSINYVTPHEMCGPVFKLSAGL